MRTPWRNADGQELPPPVENRAGPILIPAMVGAAAAIAAAVNLDAIFGLFDRAAALLR